MADSKESWVSRLVVHIKTNCFSNASRVMARWGEKIEIRSISLDQTAQLLEVEADHSFMIRFDLTLPNGSGHAWVLTYDRKVSRWALIQSYYAKQELEYTWWDKKHLVRFQTWIKDLDRQKRIERSDIERLNSLLNVNLPLNDRFAMKISLKSPS